MPGATQILPDDWEGATSIIELEAGRRQVLGVQVLTAARDSRFEARRGRRLRRADLRQTEPV